MLGGLMRGTMGAFIRGGLDTATQAIQQANVADEEEIVNKLEQFGAKKTAYNEGMQKYEEESKLIGDVASTLAIQDDEFLQDVSDQDMRSIARSLITMSGATDSGKAIEYFVNNRDNLAPKQLGVSSPSVSTQSQTEKMLSTSGTSSDTPEKPHFIKRLFTGKTPEQIRAAVIDRAGVSENVYEQVMAGSMPQRPDMTMGLALGRGDQYAEVIKDNNTGVLAAIRTGQPIYNTPEGIALARSYMQAYAAYGAKADDAPSATELLDMQNRILTAAAPPEAKDFFSNYDSMLTSMNTLLFSDNITDGQRTKAMPVYKEVLKMKNAAVADPINFGSDPTNAHAFSEKVFELADMLDVGSNGDRFKLVGTILDDALKHARTNSDQYTKDGLERLFQMPQQLQIAKDKGDMSIVDGIYSVLQDTIPVKPEGGDSLTDYDKKIRDMTEVILSRNPSMDETKAAIMAKEQVNSGTFKSSDGYFYRLTTDGTLERIEFTSPTSGLPEPKGKILNNNNTVMKRNINTIYSLGEQTRILGEHPNGYNFIGSMILRTGDIFDIANSLTGANLDIGQDAVTKIQRLRQRSKPLISSAKDALFEDPRLSDQDLRIVLDYVAIIGDPLIGSTRAMAALMGITEALSADYAMRLYENNRGLEIVKYNDRNFINVFDEQGNVDTQSTVAGRTFAVIAQSQGVELLNKQQIDALSAEEKKVYAQKLGTIGKMTQRSVDRVLAYRDAGSTEEYRRRYQNRSTLHSYGAIGQAASKEGSGVKSFEEEMTQGQQRWSNVSYE